VIGLWLLGGCEALVVSFTDSGVDDTGDDPVWTVEQAWARTGQVPWVRALSSRFVATGQTVTGDLEVLVIDSGGRSEERLTWSPGVAGLPHALSTHGSGADDSFAFAWVEPGNGAPNAQLVRPVRQPAAWAGLEPETVSFVGSADPVGVGLTVEDLENPHTWLVGCSPSELGVVGADSNGVLLSEGIDATAGTVCFTERTGTPDRALARACTPGGECHSFSHNPLNEEQPLGQASSGWDGLDLAAVRGHGDLVVALSSTGEGSATWMDGAASAGSEVLFGGQALAAVDVEVGDRAVAVGLLADGGSGPLQAQVGASLSELAVVDLVVPDLGGVVPTGVGVASLGAQVLVVVAGDSADGAGVVMWSVQALE